MGEDLLLFTHLLVELEGLGLAPPNMHHLAALAAKSGAPTHAP